jgi:RNA-directed DNA polymerase
MREKIRDLHVRRQAQLSLDDVAQLIIPLLRGWINDHWRYSPTVLQPILRYINQTLLAWGMRKFKRFSRRKTRAGLFLQGIAARNSGLLMHWHVGMTTTFARWEPCGASVSRTVLRERRGEKLSATRPRHGLHHT